MDFPLFISLLPVLVAAIMIIPVKRDWKTLLLVRATRACFCLLLVCAPVAAAESAAETEPVNAAATDIEGGGEQTDVEHEDIIDRVFSPLDSAVSDINRDINKGEDRAAPESQD